MTKKNNLDLSNLLSPAVFLDTNVIRAAKENSPPFQILVELAKSKAVKVILPEIVVEERRTQWREQYTKHVTEAKKTLATLVAEKTISEEVGGDFASAICKLDELDTDALSQKRYQKFLSDNGFEVCKLTIEDAQKAWEGYFAGSPPFKEVKNRSDIPDAHILASVHSNSRSASEAYFVAGDKAMFAAAEVLEGINAFQTIDDLITSERFVELRNGLEVEKKWQKFKSLISDTSIKEHVAKLVYENGDELLLWEDVHDHGIPEDNHTASIQSCEITGAVSVGKVEDWGSGFLRCPANFSVEALLGFSVFRGDAFDVPDWVTVTYGDFENDHYFDAEGYRQLDVKVDVVVKIDLDQLSSSGDGELFEVEFERGNLTISLSDDQ